MIPTRLARTPSAAWAMSGFLSGSPHFFTINGTDYASGGFTATFPETTVLNFSAQWFAPSAIAGSRTISYVSSTGQISDLLTLNWVTTGFNRSGAITDLSGTFTSAHGTASLGFLTGSENAANVFLEGTPALFSLPNLAGEIQSDVSPAASAVPEPGSFLLLGTGIAAAVARRRFKNRT